MSKRYDDGRRGIEAASQALARLRRESGAEGLSSEGEAGSAAGLRAALDAARRALEEKARELESSRARVGELERERAELLALTAAPRPDPALAERVQRAEAEALKVKQAASAEAAAMNGRLSIQQAEFVRLNSLRRKAEEAVSQSELTRREVEEALRRDLRTVHAALDRAAAEAGAREARAQSDIQGLTRRLEAALTRTEQLSREQQAERDRWRAERARLAATLQRSAAVDASLRRDLADLRRGLDLGVEELSRRLAASEAETAKARAGRAGAEEISRRLAAAEAELATARAGQDARASELSLRLAESEAALAKALAGQNARAEELSRLLASSEPELWKARAAEEASAEELSRLARLLSESEAGLAKARAAGSARVEELSVRLAAAESELAKALGAQDARAEELTRLSGRLSESEAGLAKARAAGSARVEELSVRLAAAESELAKALGAQDARAEELTRLSGRLAESEGELSKSRVDQDALAVRLAASEEELSRARAAMSVAPAPPSREAPRSEGAAALVARLKPAAAAAYERLRELSAVVPLSDAESASLRSAASAVAGLSDTVGVVERCLDDGPAGAPGALSPALERAAADWEAALSRKGCRLSVKLEADLGAAVFDPSDLRLVLDQLLRRAFETLPPGCALELSARGAGKFVEMVLEDDGPGASSREADVAFELGPDFTGLALPLARRALRRWGGDVRLEASASGGGRLVLAFPAA